MTTADVADRIVGLLGERPRTFYEITRALDEVEYRVFLRAWGAVRERGVLGRDEDGRYLLRPGARPGS
jgi:hypothetical protein